MKSIIRWTLYMRRWSIFGWSIGTFALVFISMIFYPSFKDSAEELQKSFDSLPDAAVQLFGGSTDFFSPVGFLNSQIMYITLPFLLGILAITIGSNLIAREESSKTIESILARPISRSTLLFSKALAGLGIITAVSFVSLLTTLITARIVDLDVSAWRITVATLSCYLLVVSFGSIAFALTASGRDRGFSLGIATAYALGGYVIGSLAGTVSWLSVPSKIFAFYYYRSEDILSGTIDWANFLFYFAVIIISLSVGWAIFKQRDLA